MNRNRDYFSRPLQGNGRDHSDYGRSTIEPEPKDTGPSLMFSLALLALVGAIIAFDLWRTAP